MHRLAFNEQKPLIYGHKGLAIHLKNERQDNITRAFYWQALFYVALQAKSTIKLRPTLACFFVKNIKKVGRKGLNDALF
jgi:hypothetical protein